MRKHTSAEQFNARARPASSVSDEPIVAGKITVSHAIAEVSVLLRPSQDR
jgi:hypothetical protein